MVTAPKSSLGPALPLQQLRHGCVAASYRCQAASYRCAPRVGAAAYRRRSLPRKQAQIGL